MMLFLALFITLFQTIHSETCNEFQECVKESINLGSSSVTCNGAQGCYDCNYIYATSVTCSGYYACASGGNIQSRTGSTTCSGYRACFSANSVTSSYGIVYCTGAMGCEQVPRIQAYNDGTVKCDGYYGCRNSGSILAKDVYCSGDGACDGIGEIEAQNVYCNGEASCTDTTIVPDNIAALSVFATGNDAMSGSVIDCSVDGLLGCNVLCYGTGCQGLTILYNTVKSEIDLQPEGCKANANQGQDIGSEEIVIFCPTLVAGADYDYRANAAKKGASAAKTPDIDDGEEDEIMKLFAEVDGAQFLSSNRPMDVKDVLFYASMMINGVFMVTCVYQRYKKKEYLPL